MIDVGILGGSGYTGGELLRILLRHPSLRAAWATSRQHAGREVAEVFPSLRDFTSLSFTEPDIDGLPKQVQAVFVALPHTEAMNVVPTLLERGVKVVDLSADFRLEDPAVYSTWYGCDHGSPALIEEAVYGLTEWNRDQVSAARLVANPGCYPTAALLALLPLVGDGLVAEGEIVVHAKSGVSGAGRAPQQKTLFCEVDEGLSAYLAGRHRHLPEIEQELSKAAGGTVSLTFVPHLVPLSRGLLETIYLKLGTGAGLKQVEESYHRAYADATFVKTAPPGVLPGIRDVAGTNLCRIGFTDDPRGGRVVLVSVIDNLVKGAAGQAVQNLNLMFGLAEGAGLDTPGLYP